MGEGDHGSREIQLATIHHSEFARQNAAFPPKILNLASIGAVV
jgi:hypothetical protein